MIPATGPSSPGPTRELRSDCARCAGLCCVVPPFDAGQGFAFDKPAHLACRHLDADDRCTIHAALEASGFAGCAAFECHGAGQWVVQVLGAGRSWRESPGLAARLFAAYPRFRALHELLAMIEAAGRVLSADEAPAIASLSATVEAACDGETASPASVALEPLRRSVILELRALAGRRAR